MLLNGVLSLAMVAIILLAMREVWAFHRKREVYHLRRLTLRLTTAGMLLFLLVSVLIAVKLGLNEPYGLERQFIVFWGSIMLLVGGIICLVIADFQTIGDDALHQANQYWDEIAKTLADHHKEAPKE